MVKLQLKDVKSAWRTFDKSHELELEGSGLRKTELCYFIMPLCSTQANINPPWPVHGRSDGCTMRYVR